MYLENVFMAWEAKQEQDCDMQILTSHVVPINFPVSTYQVTNP
jgi:hypothetical protein